MRPPPEKYDKALVASRRQRVWQSMRIMRRFTLNDLVVTAEVGYAIVAKFVWSLCQIGLVAKIASHSGGAGDFSIYVLKKMDIVKPPKIGTVKKAIHG
jgi:hypothetical protein